MSVISHSVSGFFKSLFGKNVTVDMSEVPSDINEDQATTTMSSPAPVPVQSYRQSSPANGNGNGYAYGQDNDFALNHNLGNGPKHDDQNGHAADNGAVVEISLQAIICAMQPELRSRVRQAVPDALTIPISLDKIVSQLSQGAVKIPFGDIRKMVPEVFAPPADADQLSVALPLSEILPHVNPSMLSRRPAQKPAPISDDITSPFALGAQGLSIASETPKATPPPAAPPIARRTVTPPAATPPPAPVSQPAVVQRKPVAPVPAEVPPTFQRAQATPPPANVPAPFQRTQPTPPPVARQSITSVPTPPAVPTVPLPSVTPIPFSRPAVVPVAPPVAKAPVAPPAPIAPVVKAPVAPPTPITPVAPTPAPIPVAAPAPTPIVAAAPQPAQPIPVATPVNEAPPLVVSLAAMAQGWPETIRQEITRLNLGDAQVAFPVALIEAGLKRGRIVFPWKTLQSWIKPAPLPSVSANDAVELSLPLHLIAPLFISRRKSASAAAQKVAVDETIPNLFFGFPQPTAPAPAAVAPVAPVLEAAEPVLVTEEVAPVAKPTETNYYFLEDSAGTQPAAEEFKRPIANATDFSSRKASPEDIIKRAAALEGIVGVLIALPDGLKVASSIPADQNGDTLAAFLPQLFNKMSQCTRELRMGELNNLNFTVGNVPWKIFRVNAVFFAAFGRPGQPLPTAQLVALAGELDRKNK